MAELIDAQELSTSQMAELHEGGEVWIHDNGTAQDIKLEAGPATLLFDFLLLHQDRLIRHRDAPAVSTAYQQAKPAIDAYVQSNPFVEDESHGEIDWKSLEAEQDPPSHDDIHKVEGYRRILESGGNLDDPTGPNPV